MPRLLGFSTGVIGDAKRACFVSAVIKGDFMELLGQGSIQIEDQPSLSGRRTVTCRHVRFMSGFLRRPCTSIRSTVY